MLTTLTKACGHIPPLMQTALDEQSQRHSDRISEMLKHGFTSLFRRASRHGHWQEVRSTALAAMCVQLREDGQSLWLRTIGDWLRAKQIQEGESSGSWGEEVWDTAMCIIALKDLEVSSKDPAIESAMAWMGSLFSQNRRDNWHDEPWETSWALLAVCRCGRLSQRIDVEKALTWLVSLQTANGIIVAPHYTAYFVLIESWSSRLALSEECRILCRDAKTRCVSALNQLLEESPAEVLWTGEPWSNGQILWALCSTGSFPFANQVLVEKTLAWFEHAQAADGSWFDAEDTSSAILGCVALLELLTLGDRFTQPSSRQEVRREIELQLRRAVRVPSVASRLRVVERDPETGYIAINLREQTVKIVLWFLGIVFVSGTGFIVNAQQFFQLVKELLR